MNLICIIIPYNPPSNANRHGIWIAHVEKWFLKQELKFYPRERYDADNKEFRIWVQEGDVIRWGCKQDANHHLGIIRNGKLEYTTSIKDCQTFFKTCTHDFSNQQRYESPDAQRKTIPQAQATTPQEDQKKMLDEAFKKLPQANVPVPESERFMQTPEPEIKKLPKQLKDYTTAELITELRDRGIWFEN